MSDGWGDPARFAANLVILAAGVSAVPIALKVIVGVLWMVAGVWCRSVLDEFRNRAARCESGSSVPSINGHQSSGVRSPGYEILNATARRHEPEPRMLKDVILNKTWLIEKADAPREPREFRDDLEARPCQT